MLRSLKHKRIVRFVGFYEDAKLYYLVTECVAGGDVYTRLRRKGGFYREYECRALARQLVDVLEYLHALGVVHRDVKHENLLLVEKNNDVNIKLCDFGLAVRLRPGQLLDDFCGTAEFAGPEIVTCRPYGTAVDMWACGVVLFSLLSGTRPFEHRDRAALGELIRGARYSFTPAEFWKDVSEDAKNLIATLFQVNPGNETTATLSFYLSSVATPLVRPGALSLSLSLSLESARREVASARAAGIK